MRTRLSKWATVAASIRISIDSYRLFQVATRTVNTHDWAVLVLRFTPALLDKIAASRASLQDCGERFSKVVSHFRFGRIFKLTSRDRTTIADAMVLRLTAQFTTPRLLEVGVSDGSSAIGLLRQRNLFSSIVLTDRHNMLFRRPFPGGEFFYDSDRNLLSLKFLFLSLDLTSLGLHGDDTLIPVETANPVLRSKYGIRSITRFDMFHDIMEPQVQIIKCANLLNRSYFTNKEMFRAARNLSRSIQEGGYLVVSQNHKGYADGEAAFALRKADGMLRFDEGVHGHMAESLFHNPLPLLQEEAS